MSIQTIFYISTILFLLGIAGLFTSRDIVSVFVTYQLLIVAAIINFLSFFIHRGFADIWDKIFLILGSIAIYLLIFFVLFYIYLNTGIIERKKIIKDYRLFIPKRSDWWGEDNI
jgi:NADH:ubiquinone oxidoreductase subunit K